MHTQTVPSPNSSTQLQSNSSLQTNTQILTRKISLTEAKNTKMMKNTREIKINVSILCLLYMILCSRKNFYWYLATGN